ncbi:hypothetical protein BOTCAL_0045g00360 [Botryotinia calthae]|uniref:Uncharacterized protein n=1 Tax=Botryotinia calthae TaxID=38488 RepID=A0A4Y8DE27_9HELO|nr:hypothetical protein BOTCAL_0045g00360 [Botryotinia calthae]
MSAPETLPVIARHLLRYNQSILSKTHFQSTAKNLYHQTSSVKAFASSESVRGNARNRYDVHGNGYLAHGKRGEGMAAANVEMLGVRGFGTGAMSERAHVSISARIAASKGDRERILKSIMRARERRGMSGEGNAAVAYGERKIWEEQVYPPVDGWLV